MRKFLLLLVLPLLSQGCATVSPPKAGTITLENALESVGAGLVKMKEAELKENKGKEFMSGLMPSEAEVVFNISATSSKDGKLYVELTPVSASPVQGKAGGSIGSSESVSRGNQITIKFRNIAFGKTTTTSKDGQSVIVEGITDPVKLAEFIKVSKDGGVAVLDNSSGAQAPVNQSAGNGDNGGSQGGHGGFTILQVPVPGLDKTDSKKR